MNNALKNEIIYILSDNTTIILKDGKAILRTIEKYNQTKNYRLARISCLVLSMFDGRRTFSEIINHISNVLSIDTDKALAIVNKVFDVFAQYIEESCGELRDFPSEEEILASVASYTYDDLKWDPAPFPASIYYSATNKCAFKCKYCYRDSNINLTEHDYLTLERWDMIFRETRNTRCTSFDIGGGEPFLRKDITDILGLAKKYGLKTKVSTKMALSDDVIEKLVEAEVDTLQVSLDSSHAKETAFLTGIEKSYYMATTTIDKAKQKGLNVHINCVITKYNIDTIPDLLRLAESKQIKTVSLTKYIASCGRNDPDLYATREQFDKLDDFIFTYRSTNPQIEVDYQYMLGRTYENLTQTDLAALRVLCGGGKDQLFVRHDGVVGFCDALLYDDHIILGDLKRQSISEVWNSKETEKWNTPDQSLYQNSICGSCRLFMKCFPYRCYKRSIIAYKTPYERDPFCPRGEKLLCVM